MRYNKAMFIVGFLGWWYGAGWRGHLRTIGERLMRVVDFFSIDLLIKTWFAPFRQIAAGRTQGGLSEQMRAFLDRLVSRMIGGVVRTMVIIIGALALVATVIMGIVEGILWVISPLFPVIGVVAFAIGWVPDVSF